MAGRNPQYDYLLKYIIIGDACVGKSNLLLRYANGEFRSEYQTTIGVEFAAKNVNIDNLTYRVQLWDTSGQETFKSITRNYYKNSACALVVYDITSRESFQNVATWIEEIRAQCTQSIYMILVGNKIDLEADGKRQVETAEGQELAEKYEIKFYETSAKVGTNVDDVFVNSAKEIAQKIKDGFYNLKDESCGIKKGTLKHEEENKELDKKDLKKNKKKSFC
jgi:Ras-related protein Rab-2A